MDSLFSQLEMHAAFTPKKPALVLMDRVYTYEMMVRGVRSVQAVLADLALDRSKAVGILIDNPGRHLIVMLALLQSGYAFSPLRRATLDIGRKFGVDVFITDEKLPVLPGARVVWADDKWFLRTDAPSDRSLDAPHEEDRIVRVSFSSGSTGVPKAFGSSWRTLNRRWQGKFLSRVASHEKFLTTVGLSGSALPYLSKVLANGNTVVLASSEQAFNAIFSFGVNEVRCSAVQAVALLEQQRAAGFELKLELFSTGSAALAPGIAEELENAFRCDVWNTYSATESSTMALAGGRVMKLRKARGNCFVPVCLIEIVDDDGRRLPRGVEGRIRAKTDAMAWPFSGNMFETDEARGDGWFYPGDIGRLDEDGLLIVTGRADEVINAGGVKFTPEILENAIKRHPALQDAAVIRMVGDAGVAEPWLAVVTDQAVKLEEINYWIAANVPGEVASVQVARIVKVNRIPMTVTGKVARQALRSELQALA